MKRYFGSENIGEPFEKAVVALGNFDGVHLGHQYILHKTVEKAKARGGTSVVYTFDPHPVKILAPESCPLLIQTIPQRLSAIESLKIDVCIVEYFTHEFAKQRPDQFFERLLIGRLGATGIVIGYDFTFGFHRGGTVEIMERLGEKHNVDVTVVEARFVGDLLLSSTEIRHAISTGAVQQANKMLGRPYRIEGKVISGKGLGGYLGAHTANMELLNELLSENGVYITATHPDQKANAVRPSVTSIGFNPTFPGGPLSVETHLIDFDGNLLGKTIAVDFLEKMRNQIAFPSVEKLHEQIRRDIEKARRWHERHRTLPV